MIFSLFCLVLNLFDGILNVTIIKIFIIIRIDIIILQNDFVRKL